MDIKALEENLSKLKNSSIVLTGQNVENDLFSILITFSQGTTLQADYWRIIKNGKHFLSSFDHKQLYGLPEPIDAVEMTKREFDGKQIVDVQFEKETGDLVLNVSDDLKLQILNFTGYEVWQIHFINGISEYSNHAREY